jgi:transposase InsO family protein
MGHSRRQILWLGVTAHPTAEWLANQLTQAFGWERTLDYLIRDRDACYGNLFVRRVRSLGIRDRPISPRSPWQNGYGERLIGSIRRECLDHVVVFGEGHLRHLQFMLAEAQIVFCVTSAPDQATHEGRTVRISRAPSQALLCQSKRPLLRDDCHPK